MAKEKINLCFFSGDITRSGGTERVSVILANEFSQYDDYHVFFVSLEERKETPFYKINDEIEICKLYSYLNRSMTHAVGIIKRLIKFIRVKQIDILVDIDGILDIYALPTKLFTNVKVISWEHFNFFQNPFVPYRKISRKLAANWADAIVTLTQEDKEYYKNNLKIKCPIQSIYNPIIWDGGVHDYNADSKILLSVGRLTYQKGFDMLIEIAKDILSEYPQWKWIVLGEGEDRAFLEEKIREYDLQEQVLLKGNVDNISEYYEKAGIFVMASRFEGLPMTLLETKPFQLPLVSFQCKTGPKELIQNDLNGYLIEENNLSAMSVALKDLMKNREKRIYFSQNALIDIEKFELKLIIAQWNQLFKQLKNQ